MSTETPTEPSLPLPDRPSVAVLPFVDEADDFDAQAFADGISGHITDALACTPGLFVSARDSAFTFKGRGRKPRDAALRLGVEHVLAGEVSRADDRLRLRARLFRAATDEVVWSERFEDDAQAVFDIQGEIVRRTITALAPGTAYDAAVLARTRLSADVGVYAKFLTAYANYALSSAGSARSLIGSIDAIRRIVPDQPMPYALMAQCYTNLVVQGWSGGVAEDAAEGARLARMALDRVAPERADPTILMMVGHTLAFLAQDYDAALGLLDRALELNPNSAPAYERSGWVRCYVGQPEVAAAHFRKAKRQSPLDSTTFRFNSGLGLALCMSGAHEEAVGWLRRALAEEPAWTSSHRVLAASLAHLGRQGEAEAAARTLLDLEPSYTIGRALLLYRPSPGRDRFVEGLRRAGVPA